MWSFCPFPNVHAQHLFDDGVTCFVRAQCRPKARPICWNGNHTIAWHFLNSGFALSSQRRHEKLGFRVESLKVGDYETELEFSSYAYDGELPSEESCDDKFERICDIFGFSSFDLNYRRAKVNFEY